MVWNQILLILVLGTFHAHANVSKDAPGITLVQALLGVNNAEAAETVLEDSKSPVRRRKRHSKFGKRKKAALEDPMERNLFQKIMEGDDSENEVNIKNHSEEILIPNNTEDEVNNERHSDEIIIPKNQQTSRQYDVEITIDHGTQESELTQDTDNNNPFEEEEQQQNVEVFNAEKPSEERSLELQPQPMKKISKSRKRKNKIHKVGNDLQDFIKEMHAHFGKRLQQSEFFDLIPNKQNQTRNERKRRNNWHLSSTSSSSSSSSSESRSISSSSSESGSFESRSSSSSSSSESREFYRRPRALQRPTAHNLFRRWLYLN